MTEKTIQSLETAMENIAHDIEIETNGDNADYKAIMSRVYAMERMNRLLPGVKETAPSESDDSNGAE